MFKLVQSSGGNGASGHICLFSKPPHPSLHKHCLSGSCATCCNLFRMYPKVLAKVESLRISSFSVPWADFFFNVSILSSLGFCKGKKKSHDTQFFLLILSIWRWMKSSPSLPFPLPQPGMAWLGSGLQPFTQKPWVWQATEKDLRFWTIA